MNTQFKNFEELEAAFKNSELNLTFWELTRGELEHILSELGKTEEEGGEFSYLPNEVQSYAEVCVSNEIYYREQRRDKKRRQELHWYGYENSEQYIKAAIEEFKANLEEENHFCESEKK